MTSDNPSESSPLGERVAARILEVYVETFGSLEPLREELPLHLPAAQLSAAHLRSLGPHDLARLGSAAVRHLAMHENTLARRESLRRTDWRVILYCLASAQTLRGAIERCAEAFEAIDGRCGKMSLRVRGDQAQLELDTLRTERTAAWRLIEIYGMASIHSMLGVLIAQPIPLRQLVLAQEPSEFQKLGLPELAAPVLTGASWTGFVFPATFLDYPVLRTVEDLISRSPQNFLFPVGGQDRPDAPAAEEVRRIAMRGLQESQRLPAFEEIVGQMGGSAATLRRRLSREGVSYREIKDSCRRELALNLLRRPDLPIEEIAGRLDFCDSDAFRRAFNDWLGMPPSRYRREAVMADRR
jgi:AraC-like DNA-binding protein